MITDLRNKMRSALEVALSNYILGCCDSVKRGKWITRIDLPKPYVQTSGDEVYIVVSVGVTNDGDILGGIVLSNKQVHYIPLPLESLFYFAVVLDCDDNGFFEFLENVKRRELEE